MVNPPPFLNHNVGSAELQQMFGQKAAAAVVITRHWVMPVTPM